MGEISKHRRVSLNLRIDPDKYDLLEKARITGFGFAQTERNRSDVYNEALGYGLQVRMLRDDLGDRDFEKFWSVINKVNWRKFNLEKLSDILGK